LQRRPKIPNYCGAKPGARLQLRSDFAPKPGRRVPAADIEDVVVKFLKAHWAAKQDKSTTSAARIGDRGALATATVVGTGEYESGVRWKKPQGIRAFCGSAPGSKIDCV
jgi:hypothetical protein